MNEKEPEVMRVGMGYDSHRLQPGRDLIIGGVHIPYAMGLAGHSDADVLCHSIIDAILGAVGLGDIGTHFPDTDPRWKDASSIDLLRYIVGITQAAGFQVAWIDATVIAEAPKLGPFFEEMRERISSAGIPPGCINLKAKTNEGMGFVGRCEGIVSLCVCTLRKSD